MGSELTVLILKKEWEDVNRRGFQRRRTMIGHIPARKIFNEAREDFPLCGSQGEYVSEVLIQGQLGWNWIEPCKKCFYQILAYHETEKEVEY